MDEEANTTTAKKNANANPNENSDKTTAITEIDFQKEQQRLEELNQRRKANVILKKNEQLVECIQALSTPLVAFAILSACSCLGMTFALTVGTTTPEFKILFVFLIILLIFGAMGCCLLILKSFSSTSTPKQIYNFSVLSIIDVVVLIVVLIKVVTTPMSPKCSSRVMCVEIVILADSCFLSIFLIIVGVGVYLLNPFQQQNRSQDYTQMTQF